MTRIPIRYNRTGRVVLSMCGAPPSTAYLECDGDAVRVRMGWGRYVFRGEFPRAAISDVVTRPRAFSLGAHGWRGQWLVNGAGSPLASIRLADTASARVLGWRVKLNELIVSVDDPDALRAELLASPAL